MIAFEILGVALLLLVGTTILVGNSKFEKIVHRDTVEGNNEQDAKNGQQSA